MMRLYILILIALCLIGVINSYIYITPWTAGHIRRGKSLFAEPEEPKDDKKQNTRFARGLDDFVGKRYGAGEAFYGKRKSEMSEEDFQAMRLLRAPKQEEIVQDLRNNAILVVGGIEDVNQWAVFDLLQRVSTSVWLPLTRPRLSRFADSMARMWMLWCVMGNMAHRL